MAPKPVAVTLRQQRRPRPHRPHHSRLHLAAGLLLCTAALLPLPHATATASAATAAAMAAEAVLDGGDTSGRSQAPDTGPSTPAPT
ncbi:hypothetical protein, partial [Streptomyces monomycini]